MKGRDPLGVRHRHRRQDCGAAAHGMFWLVFWALLGVVRTILDPSDEKIQKTVSDSCSSFDYREAKAATLTSV